MSNHVSDEERLERMEKVYKYIMQGMSTRDCAECLREEGIIISHVTVKDYIDRMYSVNPKKYKEMQEIIKEHTPKTVSDEEVRTRIKNVVVALNAGYTFKEIAEALGESENTVYRDFRKRIGMLSQEELVELEISDELINSINSSLTQKSIDNLDKTKGKKI